MSRPPLDKLASVTRFSVDRPYLVQGHFFHPLGFLVESLADLDKLFLIRKIRVGEKPIVVSSKRFRQKHTSPLQVGRHSLFADTRKKLYFTAMRTAVCVYGISRGFTRSTVHDSILQRISEFSSNADIYIILKGVQPETYKRVFEIAQKFKASSIVINANITPPCLHPATYMAEDGRLCRQLFEQSEMKNGFRYRWVLRMRPDEQICMPLNMNDSFVPRNRTVYTWRGPGPSVHDHFAIMPRDVANVYMSNLSSRFYCASDHTKFFPCHMKYPVAECYLSGWLRHNRIGWDSHVLGRETICLWDELKVRRCTKCHTTERLF